jgi:hypothetical protein
MGGSASDGGAPSDNRRAAGGWVAEERERTVVTRDCARESKNCGMARVSKENNQQHAKQQSTLLLGTLSNVLLRMTFAAFHPIPRYLLPNPKQQQFGSAPTLE